jgi:hypothetical protein
MFEQCVAADDGITATVHHLGRQLDEIDLVVSRH